MLNSVDMDKVINSLGQKDRQLQQLKSETKETNLVLSKIYETRAKEINVSRMKVVKEAKVKEQAFKQMASMKMEVEMLRKG